MVGDHRELSAERDRMFRRAGPTRSRTHTRHMDDMYTKLVGTCPNIFRTYKYNNALNEIVKRV